MLNSDKIERYNNDFYLNWDGSQNGSDLFDNSNIAKSNDWAVSFFDIRNNTGNGVNFIQSIFGNKIGVSSGFAVKSKGSSSNYAIEVSVYDGSETIYTLNSNSLLDSINRIYHVFLTYDSISGQLSFYLNGVLKDGVNLTSKSEWSNPSFVKIGSLGDVSSFNKIGGISDLCFYNSLPSFEDVKYTYKKGVNNTSFYSMIEHFYPLNQVPYESGGNYFVRDVAELYNPSATGTDLHLLGWTASELGFGVGGLPASTTYRGWDDKLNYIPTNLYDKGLNFDRTKQQYLEVTGLEQFDKDDGYTFLIGAEKTEINPNTQHSFFSVLADEGFTTWFDIFRRGGTGNENELQFASPTIINTTDIISSNFGNVDVQQKNFLSYFTSNQKYINPYSTTIINKIIDINCQQDYTSGYYQGLNNNRLGVGFDELTNPKFQIGARNGVNNLNGKIYFLTIIKGPITKEEEKKVFNNGLFRSPYDVLLDTDKIILDVDLTNPFVDGSDIKFPDNSGNCEVIAKGTDWDTLLGVQNSID